MAFHEMLAYGLYHGWNAPTQITFQHLPHDLHLLYSTQAHLGWKQLYYSCFMPLWICLLNHHHPQLNGSIYLTKIITLIWQSVLKIWKVCNDHLHPSNPEQEDHSQLQAAVNQIFFEACQDPILQTLVENLTAEQIMNRPT